MNGCFLCRRRRKWPSSRQRFLPHQARLGSLLRCLASTYPRAPQPTRRSQAPASQRRPTRAWPCLCVFASKPASHGTSATPPVGALKAIPQPVLSSMGAVVTGYPVHHFNSQEASRSGRASSSVSGPIAVRRPYSSSSVRGHWIRGNTAPPGSHHPVGSQPGVFSGRDGTGVVAQSVKWPSPA